MHGAEVILEGAVAVDGHAQVELGHEGKERTRAVTVLDGPQADSKQPVNVLHLLLRGEVVNMLSRLLITFLPRSNHLLISWLQSPSVLPQ